MKRHGTKATKNPAYGEAQMRDTFRRQRTDKTWIDPGVKDGGAGGKTFPLRNVVLGILSALVVAVALAGCSPTMSTHQAVEQLAGATQAVSELATQLPSTGPTAADAHTVAQIQGYAAWAGVALQVVKIAMAAGL